MTAVHRCWAAHWRSPQTLQDPLAGFLASQGLFTLELPPSQPRRAGIESSIGRAPRTGALAGFNRFQIVQSREHVEKPERARGKPTPNCFAGSLLSPSLESQCARHAPRGDRDDAKFQVFPFPCSNIGCQSPTIRPVKSKSPNHVLPRERSDWASQPCSVTSRLKCTSLLHMPFLCLATPILASSKPQSTKNYDLVCMPFDIRRLIRRSPKT